MTAIYLTLTIIAFVIILLLNIFFVYIPLSQIEDDLNDVNTEVQNVKQRLEPVIVKVEPFLESFLS